MHNQNNELEQILTITEARAWLRARGVETGADTLNHNCRVGNIKARKTGKLWLVSTVALNEFLTNPPRPGPRPERVKIAKTEQEGAL